MGIIFHIVHVVIIAPPPAAKAPPPPPPKAPTTTPQTPLIKKPIFKSAQSSPASFSPLNAVLDSFASDSKLSHAVEVTAEASASHVPELFRSVVGEGFGMKVPPNTPAGTPAKGKAVEAASSSVTLSRSINRLVDDAKNKGREVVSGHLPALPIPMLVVAGRGLRVVGDFAGWTKEWWRAERLGKVVEGCLPRRELDILVIEGPFNHSSDLGSLLTIYILNSVNPFNMRIPIRRPFRGRPTRHPPHPRSTAFLPLCD